MLYNNTYILFQILNLLHKLTRLPPVQAMLINIAYKKKHTKTIKTSTQLQKWKLTEVRVSQDVKLQLFKNLAI